MRLPDDYRFPSSFIRLEFNSNKPPSGGKGDGAMDDEPYQPPYELDPKDVNRFKSLLRQNFLIVNELEGGKYDHLIPDHLKGGMDAQLIKIKSSPDAAALTQLNQVKKIIMDSALDFVDKLKKMIEVLEIKDWEGMEFSGLNYKLQELRLQDKGLNAFFNSSEPFAVKYNVFNYFDYAELSKRLVDPLKERSEMSALEAKVFDQILDLQPSKIRKLQNAYKLASMHSPDLANRVEALRADDKKATKKGQDLPSEKLLDGVPCRGNFYELFADFLAMKGRGDLDEIAGYESFDRQFILRLIAKLLDLSDHQRIRDIVGVSEDFVVETAKENWGDADEAYEELCRIVN